MAKFRKGLEGGPVIKHPEWARKTKERLAELREKDEKHIRVSSPIVKTNLITWWEPKCKHQENPEDFDWSLYEDGWNGHGLKINKNIKTEKGDKVYCHEKYAQSAYKKYCRGASSFEDGVKDLVQGNIVKIRDAKLIGGDELLISTTTGGSAIVNLAKENRFFDMLGTTKQEYKNHVFGTEKGRKEFIESGYLAKIGNNGRASLYDGVLIKDEQEFMEQIALGPKANKAYVAHIDAANKGGFICTVRGHRCFLPGSQATSNRLLDFDSMVGRDIEVMMMKFIEGTGFLVSRKMYLQRVLPIKIAELREEWKKNPEKIYRGTVTGSTHFGVFIELNEFYTGLLHKTYATQQTLDRIAASTVPSTETQPIVPGEWFDVIIYNITDDNRIVFTNIVDINERKAIVEIREKIEAEEEARKAALEKAAKEAAYKEKVKNLKASAEGKFEGKSIKLEDLKK